MTSPGELVGRRIELAAFDRLLDGLDAGGAAVLIEGDAGVGKTALVGEIERRASARNLTVLRTAGTPEESSVAYAGLHTLLHPLRSRFSGLPGPQREALDQAFGVAVGPPASPFLVGLAALTLLTDTAKRGAVLVVAEDLHWLDPASRSALMVLARRVRSDPVLVTMTTRERDDVADESGVERLDLQPLSLLDANALLDAAPEPTHGVVRRRLLELAEGNPLALIELSPAELASPGHLDLVPLTRRLETAFAGRFADLPGPTRVAVLASALGGGESASEALEAAARVVGRGPRSSWLDPAFDGRLLEGSGDRLRFRHPLMRAAVTSASTGSERAAVLAALVDTVGDDPHRTLWWRAELADDADAALADELDALARRSIAADDARQALRALDCSARLTPGRERRVERTLRAAEAAARVGAHGVAAGLLERAETESDDAGIHARAAWEHELLALEGSALGRGDFGPALEAIEGMRRAGDVDRAVDALAFLASIAWDRSTDAGSARRLLDVAGRFGLEADDPRLLMLAAVTDPAEHGDQVIDRIRGLADPDPDDADRAWQLGYALNMSGEIEPAWRHLRTAVDGLRRYGRVDLLPHALMGLSWIGYLRGTFAHARSYVEECLTIAVDLADPGLAAAARAALAWYDAIDGVTPDRAAIAGRSPLALQTLDSRSMRATLAVADGAAALADGRPRDAARLLERATDADDRSFSLAFALVALPDLVVAGLLAGDRGGAEARVAGLAERCLTWHAPVVEGSLRCARLLLAAGDDPDAVSAELDADPVAMPYLQARARLWLGSRLRRAKRIDASRRELHAALTGFESFPAPRWAQRCREELRASGERLADAAPSGRHVLTPQELRIAELAAEGLTNREIAERLFLSPRTVGAHLYAAFRKLGITSREQLGTAIAGA